MKKLEQKKKFKNITFLAVMLMLQSSERIYFTYERTIGKLK